jgi:hypothetical protein
MLIFGEINLDEQIELGDVLVNDMLTFVVGYLIVCRR